MGVSLPSDEAIRARAEELGFLDAGAPMPQPVRRRVAKLLQDEGRAAADAAKAPAPAGELLSRFTYETDAGTIRVDVTLIPKPKDPTHG